MARASFLLPVLLFLFVLPAAVLAQKGADDLRFKSGNIQVKRVMQLDEAGNPLSLNMFLRDHVDFGECFEDAKYRRMPTTYYHPQGPLGLAFQKFNWFPGAANTYHADARLPASLVGLGFPGLANSPLAQLLALWSEPPVAVIGMEAGTPAAYARPFQHFHFYEQTKEVIELNERQEKDRLFHFIPDARQRGAVVRIVHGSPRQQLAQHGPHGFYHLMIMEACSGENGEKLFLDLFTVEGIAECMKHLADDGILCVHTSHRFIDLPPVLAAIGAELKLAVRRGHDQAPGSYERGKTELAEMRHFTSEWVLLARDRRLLDAVCKTPANYEELLKKMRFQSNEAYWSVPTPIKQAWTDKGPNLLHGVLRGHPFSMRYSAVMGPCTDAVTDVLRRIGVGLGMQRFVMELSRLPRPVEEWMVQEQLKKDPQVEKLWR